MTALLLGFEIGRRVGGVRRAALESIYKESEPQQVSGCTGEWIVVGRDRSGGFEISPLGWYHRPALIRQDQNEVQPAMSMGVTENR